MTAATSSPTPGVGHDYTKLLAETVDLSGGSLSVRITLPTAPARAVTLPFAFTYESNSVSLQNYSPGQATWAIPRNFFGNGPWANTLPQLSAVIQGYTAPHQTNVCYSSTAYTLQDTTGSKHALGVSAYLVNPSGTVDPSCPSTGWTTYLSGGDDFLQATISGIGANGNALYSSYGAGVGSVQVADASGTVYNFANSAGISGVWNCGPYPVISGGSIVNSISHALPSSIEDRNGNTITFSSPCGGESGASFSVSDTVGRIALSFTLQGGGALPREPIHFLCRRNWRRQSILSHSQQ
jgi:hypothetical protein